ncbi:MAG TPA: delta-60 repeat domain-containing protein [Thermoleophilaceae bacterium]|nr:delta-60 repeat domain-containing protein [Thermoleophilaceae bacterium]
MTLGELRIRPSAKPQLRRAAAAAILVAALWPLAAAAPAQAAAGDLDPSFGGDGRVTTGFPGGGDQFGQAVAIQSDGKIVVAGEAFQDFALVRYNADGSLDTTFDGDGRVRTDFGGVSENAISIAIEPDGQIVAAGFSSANGDSDIAVARYDTDGGLDTGFGGTGKVLTNVSRYGSPAQDGDDFGWDVALQPDGKIVVAGTDDENRAFEVVRYQPNGDLDASFDGDGKQTTSFGMPHTQGRAVAIQPDLRIVVAGYAGADLNAFQFAIARYTDDGTPDGSFDDDGRRTVDFAGGDDWGEDVAVQPDGRIVVSGNTESPGSDSHFALARLDPDGGLDGSFAGDGQQAIGFGGPASGFQLAIQPDGKLVQAGGFSASVLTSDFALARVGSGGELDSTFAGDGKQVTDFGGADRAADVALQADGKIVLAGLTNEGGDYDFAVARYLGDPVGGPNGTGGPATPPGTETALRYRGRSVVRVSRTGRFALALNGPAGAAGSLALRSARPFRIPTTKAQRRARPLRLGSKRFTFPATGRATLRFRLSRRNLRLLRRVRRLRTRATATARAQRITFAISLRAPARR